MPTMNNIYMKPTLAAAFCIASLLSCGIAPIQNAGGSSDTEISAKTFMGAVVDSNGKAIPNADVWLNLLGFNDSMVTGPDNKTGGNPNGPVAMTDASGVFRIIDVKTGKYSIEVNSGDSLAVFFYCSMDSGDSLKKFPPDTLRPMVIITGTIVPNGSDNTVIMIDGLTRHIQIDSSGRFQTKVPYGKHNLKFSSHGQAQKRNVSLPYLAPGTVQDIGCIDPSPSYPRPLPCEDSACDASAIRLLLSDCGLDSVAVESVATFNNGRIAGIDLRHRKLHMISMEIARLTRLEALDLGDNQLRSPFRVLSQCTSLKVLRLDSNNLAFLPDDIGSMSNLVELDLSNNEITSLPISCIGLAPAELNLDNNRLMGISGAAAEWADTYAPNWRATQRPAGNFQYPQDMTNHGF
jgi:hypothetical protein